MQLEIRIPDGFSQTDVCGGRNRILPGDFMKKMLLFCATIPLLWTPPVQAETRILFSGRISDAAAFDLYTMKANGTDLRRVTAAATAVSEWGASVAPDNFHTAYVDANGTTGNIYVGDLRGGTPVKVNVTGKALAVDWIDSNWLCYLNRNGPYDGDFTIRKVKKDGTGDAAVYATVYHNYSTGGDSIHVERAAGRIYFSALNASFAVTIYSGLLTGTGPDRTYSPGVDALDTANGEAGNGTPETTLWDLYDPAVTTNGTKLVYAADHGSGFHRIYTKNKTPAETASVSRRGDVYCGDPRRGEHSAFRTESVR